MTWMFFILFILVIAATLMQAFKRGKAGAVESLPYEKKTTLISPAERSFLGVLEQAVAGRYRVYAQVRLADLMKVKAGTNRAARAGAQNRINGKHADFVLCENDTLEVVCAIELDDASHKQVNRKERDTFVENACQAAGLRLVRFSAKAAYSVQEVRSMLALSAEVSTSAAFLREGVGQQDEAIAQQAMGQHVKETPACPRCQGDTVLRTVKAGVNAGKKLWGCKRYPVCRGYVPLA